MASIGSLPLTFDGKIERSFSLRRQPRFFFLAKWPRKSLQVVDITNSASGYLKFSDNRGLVWSFKSRKAMAKGPSSSESGDESEDAIQATIEKTKKVLATQRDLLQQIAERRKLVTSIKDSEVDPEEDQNSYQESHSSFSSPDVTKTNIKETAEKYQNVSILSSSNNYVPVKEKKPEEAPLSPTGRDFSKDDIEQVKPPSLEMAAPKPWNEIVVSSFVSSKADTSSLEVEQLQDLIEQKVEEVHNVGEDTWAEDVKPPPLAGANVMNIILVAAECTPWSKTGGLGDVAGSLPKALARRGHRVMVVAPRYANYDGVVDTGIRKRYKVAGQDLEVGYFQTYVDGVDFVFIDNNLFHHREQNIYGGERMEILRRMVLFCKAAVEVPWHIPCGGVCYGDGNLAFIANDWHTALLPVYLKAYYRDHGLMTYTRSILVIHNIAHQGRGPMDDFKFVDLPGHHLDLFRMYDPVGGEHFNIFAAGLKTADRVVTVSHGYAWELKTLEGGWGLHNIINESDWKFSGIVNGIDSKEWSPKSDVHLTSDGYTNYSLETLQIGKPKCKEALQKELGLPVREDVPLIGFIGRLDHQKGVDLIAEAVPWMMEQDVQLVMLGTGRQDLEEMLRQFENHHKDKVRGWVGFSVKMAHRITAGADVLLMPSRFEPCGLNQLYAMSYGTVPVVHAVGGLRDTVQQFDPFNESGFGWTFDRAEAHKLIHALGNCLLTFREYKQSWEGLQRRGMMQDLSWDHAAVNYEEVLVAAKYQW